MVRRIALFMLILVGGSLSAFPQKFYIEYQTLTHGSLFLVKTEDNEVIGKVERIKGKNELFLFQTLDNHLLAQAEVKREGDTTIGQIKIGEDQEIGHFMAKIHTVYPSEFKLYSQHNELIANGWMNWIGNRFSLADPDNPHREYAAYSRPRFMLYSDCWYVEILEEAIDPTLLVLIGTYQTSLNLGLEG